MKAVIGLLGIGGVFALVVAIVPLGWWLFQVVFNVVVHDVFNGPSITFWQAAACCVLLSFVTGGLRGSVKS